MKAKITHVGSLPFEDLKEALDYTFRFDIPVLSSLPKVDEKFFMGKDILSYTENWTDFDRDSLADIPFEKRFFDRLKQENLREFKFQLIGPVSFQKYFVPEEALEIVSQKLNIIYSPLVERFSRKGDLLFVLDEPGLASNEELEVLNSFLSNFENLNIKLGVHCCQKLNLEIFDRINCRFKQLDWALYTDTEFQKGLSYFGGLESKDPSIWSSLKFEENEVLLSPSCGLVNVQDPEAIFVRLKALKEYLNNS